VSLEHLLLSRNPFQRGARAHAPVDVMNETPLSQPTLSLSRLLCAVATVLRCCDCLALGGAENHPVCPYCESVSLTTSRGRRCSRSRCSTQVPTAESKSLLLNTRPYCKSLLLNTSPYCKSLLLNTRPAAGEGFGAAGWLGAAPPAANESDSLTTSRGRRCSRAVRFRGP